MASFLGVRKYKITTCEDFLKVVTDMVAEGHQSCKQCGYKFKVDKDLKRGMCRSCELTVLWNEFIMAICNGLRISRFVRWLAKQI